MVKFTFIKNRFTVLQSNLMNTRDRQTTRTPPELRERSTGSMVGITFSHKI